MGRLLSPPGPNAAHVCIDMQRLFGAGGPWATPWMEKVLPNIATLVKCAPERTIFTRFMPPKSADEARGAWKSLYRKWECVTGERLDASYLEIVDELAVYVGQAAVVDRQTYSAFGNGVLYSYLNQRNVDTLIMSGGETDVCVLSSVLAAIDIGYRVILLEDGLCSQSDESHDALIKLYTERFSIQIEVTKTEDLVAAWPPSS